MKQILPLFILTLSFFSASAQRYLTPTFEGVKMTPDVLYGEALSVDDTIVRLRMDIFEPEGDTEEARPLMVLVHGGSFVGGDRRDPLMMALCQDFARKGYVTVTMSYRLGINYANFLRLSDELTQANLRAVQDHNAAVRFFYKSARDEGNPYRIDTTRIISGGVSAGAIATLHSHLFTDVSKAPANIAQFLENLGGLEGGNNGSPGYPYKAVGLFNMMGAILDTTLISVTDVPTISFHGDTDVVVPYAQGFATFNGINVVQVQGSSLVHQRLTSLGVATELYTYPGIGHELVVDSARMVVIIERATQFFYDQVVNKNATVSTRQPQRLQQLEVYPNPVYGGVIYLSVEQDQPFMLYDISGRQLQSGRLFQGQNELRLGGLQQGMYLLRTPDAVARFLVR